MCHSLKAFATGEVYNYTYNYTHAISGVSSSYNFPIKICKGSIVSGKENSAKGYYIAYSGYPASGTARVLYFHQVNNAWIKLPAIQGKYLQTVEIQSAHTGAKKSVKIMTDPASSSRVAQNDMPPVANHSPSPCTIHFYSDGNDCIYNSLKENITEAGTSYYLLFAGDSQMVDRITVTYTNALPTR